MGKAMAYQTWKHAFQSIVGKNASCGNQIYVPRERCRECFQPLDSERERKNGYCNWHTPPVEKWGELRKCERFGDHINQKLCACRRSIAKSGLCDGCASHIPSLKEIKQAGLAAGNKIFSRIVGGLEWWA